MIPGTATHFEYRGWNVRLEVTGAGAEFAGHAQLEHDGKLQSTVTLDSPRADASSARWALDSKARDFIDAWKGKPRAGPSGFQEL